MNLENLDATPLSMDDTTTLAGLGPPLPSSPANEQSFCAPEETGKNLDHLISKLKVIFGDKALYRWLLSCRETRAQRLLDLFQKLLDIKWLDMSFRRSLIVAVQRLSEKSALYPTCYHLRGVEYAGDPIAAGGFADIYKGTFREYFLKKCAKEALLWGQLMHPNVCPIYGLYRRDARICLVSPWMDNGDLNHYLERNPQADRLLLVYDAAGGLSHLHDSGIIHGDLKGANILVSASGRACLADFGLSSVSDANILAWTSHSSAESTGGSIRWQAPELFDFDNDEAVPNSKASDIYAWSCSCYEAFTGSVPFAHLQRDASVMLQVKSGSTPPRPPHSSVSWGGWGLTEAIWSIMTACWNVEPSLRPTVHQIIGSLRHEIRRDGRPADDSILSPAQFRGEMSVYPDIVFEELEQLIDISSVPRSHLEEGLVSGISDEFQVKPLRAEQTEAETLDLLLDFHVNNLVKDTVTTARSSNDVLALASRQQPTTNIQTASPVATGGSSSGGFSPPHLQPAYSAHAPYEKQNLDKPSSNIGKSATLAVTDKARSERRTVDFKDFTGKRLASSDTYPNAPHKKSTKPWGNKLEEVTAAVPKHQPSSLPSTTGSTFKWVRGELLSRGTYGSVYLALNATTGEVFVAKQVELRRTAISENDSQKMTTVKLWTEIGILKDLDHPNIVQYLGFEATSDILSILLEYVPGGSIGSYLSKHGRLEEKVTKSFTTQILTGLEYLHSKGVLHRNLKADNILFEMSGACKISGFGISKRADSSGRAFEAMMGSVPWMAPEVINSRKTGYNSKVDIWSVGCVVMEMWTGSRPWNGEETAAVMFKLYESGQPPPLPKDFILAELAGEFRRKCFAANPKERPTADELREHAYLTLPPDWVFTGLS